MKLSNKIIIISGVICLLVIAGVIYALFNIKSPETKLNQSDNIKYQDNADNVQNNISKPLKSTDSEEKYLLRLEDGKICVTYNV